MKYFVKQREEYQCVVIYLVFEISFDVKNILFIPIVLCKRARNNDEE